MELYILDSLLRRDTVVDQFESLIWTERWASIGEFELVLMSTPENRRRFISGVQLACNTSMRMMEVETVESKVDEEGKRLLTVKGRSAEKILEDRVVKKSLANLTTEPNWKLVGTPMQVVRWMFDGICRTGQLSVYDKIPFLMPGTIMPADTIAAPAETITWEQEPTDLYSALVAVCELYEIGFRLLRNFDTSQLYFDFYMGSDRTTSQNTLPPVVFSPELDNLQNTTEFATAEEAKNCAYVYSEQGFQIVYPQGVDPEIDGFERRVLPVEAEKLEGTPTAAEITAHLTQKGLEELSQRRSWTAFDGEHSQYSEYVYGVHYNLGDLVEIRNADGVANNMRVTEQIFVHDEEGERSYPTLAVNTHINPGSWLSWAYNQVWADLGPETWAEQP